MSPGCGRVIDKSNPWGRAINGERVLNTAEGLLRACEAAHHNGIDFPTAWRTIISKHVLVTGLPAHRVANGEAQIVVTLLTGQRVISGAGGYSLE